MEWIRREWCLRLGRVSQNLLGQNIEKKGARTREREIGEEE